MDPTPGVAAWPANHIWVLISVWLEYTILHNIGQSSRNIRLYLEISQRLEQVGKEHTLTQRLQHIKHLRFQGRKAKDSDGCPGRAHHTCPFYNEPEWVLSGCPVQTLKWFMAPFLTLLALQDEEAAGTVEDAPKDEQRVHLQPKEPVEKTFPDEPEEAPEPQLEPGPEDGELQWTPPSPPISLFWCSIPDLKHNLHFTPHQNNPWRCPAKCF